MPRYRVVRQAITRRDGVAEPGDEIDPTEAELRAFGDNLERVDDFENEDYANEVSVDGEDGAEADGETDICGTEMSNGDICERPTDDCPYH